MGAGASVTAGLPTAWDFHKGLATFLANVPLERTQLLGLLTTSYGQSASPMIRFEQTMAILREVCDPSLSILSLFDDEHRQPSSLHQFLADWVLRGAILVTTNFDVLAERAADELILGARNRVGHICQLFSTDRRRAEHWLHPSRIQGRVILKLHGTIRARIPVLGERDRVARYKATRATLGATLDAIGRTSATPGLEVLKEQSLQAAVSGRWVVVLGYSGVDDFDVMPSLGRVLKHAAGLVWIRHFGNRGPTLIHDKKTLPRPLNSVSIATVTIEGDTSLILGQLLGEVMTLDKAPRVDVVREIRGLHVYQELSVSQRRIVIGRIAEFAARPAIARQYYEHVVKDEQGRLYPQARRKRPYERTYALGRIGHVQWNFGRNSDALRTLLAGLRLARLHGFKDLEANISVSIGNVYLRIGRLGLALRKYRKAYSLNRILVRQRTPSGRITRMHQATIASNIGIIYRKRGNFRAALDQFRKAYHQARRLKDRITMMWATGNMGNACYHQGRFPRRRGNTKEPWRWLESLEDIKTWPSISLI